jgi:hypothetical protein
VNVTVSEPRAEPSTWVKAVHPGLFVLLAPVLFLVHILEEVPGFLPWLNSVRSPAVPESGYLAGNVPYLLITTVLAVAAASYRRKGPALLLLIWLSYIMFANTLFHVTATVVLRRYCPGLITAVTLYLPYFFWFAGYLRTKFQIPLSVVAGTALFSSWVVYYQWHTVLFEAARRLGI